VSAASAVALVALGSLAASLGKASVFRGAARVAFWGVAAMACTALIGKLFGTAVG
jgi:VIT1/CCC1 family predicted Fe2+/Mn2+ transporter